MSSPAYQALPSDDYDEERPIARRRHVAEHIQLAQDPRFNPPTPSWWKRALLILFIISMFWLYFSMRASMQRGSRSQVVHSHRYSKQHKYRPAASPIVTEILKDGKTRIRGAAPTARSY
ncbi:hypothetical protein EI94DRAFT_1825508 [Lactarius quietus]|nr:hypothetical protein EI94DRAFT_1825508 [Lactarius quietus]